MLSYPDSHTLQWLENDLVSQSGFRNGRPRHVDQRRTKPLQSTVTAPPTAVLRDWWMVGKLDGSFSHAKTTKYRGSRISSGSCIFHTPNDFSFRSAYNGWNSHTSSWKNSVEEGVRVAYVARLIKSSLHVGQIVVKIMAARESFSFRTFSEYWVRSALHQF